MTKRELNDKGVSSFDDGAGWKNNREERRKIYIYIKARRNARWSFKGEKKKERERSWRENYLWKEQRVKLSMEEEKEDEG